MPLSRIGARVAANGCHAALTWPSSCTANPAPNIPRLRRSARLARRMNSEPKANTVISCSPGTTTTNGSSCVHEAMLPPGSMRRIRNQMSIAPMSSDAVKSSTRVVRSAARRRSVRNSSRAGTIAHAPSTWKASAPVEKSSGDAANGRNAHAACPIASAVKPIASSRQKRRVPARASAAACRQQTIAFVTVSETTHTSPMRVPPSRRARSAMHAISDAPTASAASQRVHGGQPAPYSDQRGTDSRGRSICIKVGVYAPRL